MDIVWWISRLWFFPIIHTLSSGRDAELLSEGHWAGIAGIQRRMA